MESAVSHASAAWRSTSSGAFQNAMIASPMYLSIVPRWLRIRSVIGVRNRFMNRVRPCGSNCSDMRVKPRTSVNITVISRISPPSCSNSGWRAMRST